MGTTSFRMVPSRGGPFLAVCGLLLLWLLLGASGVMAQSVDVDNPIFPPSTATPWENWEFLAALLVTVVVPVFTKQSWPDEYKAGAMLVVALIVTVGYRFLLGTLYQGDVVASILQVLVATVAYYYGIVKPLGIARAIHARTGG